MKSEGISLDKIGKCQQIDKDPAPEKTLGDTKLAEEEKHPLSEFNEPVAGERGLVC